MTTRRAFKLGDTSNDKHAKNDANYNDDEKEKASFSSTHASTTYLYECVDSGEIDARRKA
jgi:hypothetical protein